MQLYAALRGNERSLQLKQKLYLALAIYVGLALLAWNTLTDEPFMVGPVKVEFRALTLVILGVFAFRTLMGFWRLKIEEDDSRKK